MANLTQVTLVSGVPQESGTVSTIDALLALAATAAKQDTSNTSLANILTKLADPATQTTLAAVLAKLNASVAVTGTFWQATQPVSGTFFQATQPVSATALPLPAGAATSALQTTGNTSLAALAALISSGKLLVTASIDSASVNANFEVAGTSGTASHQGAPVVNLDIYSQYETVAVSTTATLGATGAVGDYLAGVLIVPGTAGCGAVSIADGNGSAISIFAGGGTTALPSLVPFMVPLGLYALAATTPGWKITTGSNVTAVGIGKFT